MARSVRHAPPPPPQPAGVRREGARRCRRRRRRLPRRQRGWVAAGNPASSPFSELPHLDGTLHLDGATRREFAQDFGQIDLPKRPNPWIDLMVPMSDAAEFIEEVQSTIAPIVDGDVFSLLLIPLRSSRFTRPLFRTPDEELAVGFDTLRALPPGTDVTSALAFNRRLYERCRELGGTRYPISAVELDVDDWAQHYGDQWDRLLQAKRRFDRGGVLASGPDVLGAAAERLGS